MIDQLERTNKAWIAGKPFGAAEHGRNDVLEPVEQEFEHTRSRQAQNLGTDTESGAKVQDGKAAGVVQIQASLPLNASIL